MINEDKAVENAYNNGYEAGALAETQWIKKQIQEMIANMPPEAHATGWVTLAQEIIDTYCIEIHPKK